MIIDEYVSYYNYNYISRGDVTGRDGGYVDMGYGTLKSRGTSYLLVTPPLLPHNLF